MYPVGLLCIYPSLPCDSMLHSVPAVQVRYAGFDPGTSVPEVWCATYEPLLKSASTVNIFQAEENYKRKKKKIWTLQIKE